MFTPPRCPYPQCPSQSDGHFHYHRRGSFTRAVDRKLVQRYTCLSCGRSFSDQTFRFDFGLRRPWLTEPIFWALCSKVTHRQAARQSNCARGTVEARLDRLAQHCEAFHARQLGRLAGQLSPDLALDELETYEADRRLKPLTVPVLLHETTWFVLDVQVAPLPARGGLAPQLEQRRDELATVEGPRTSGSTAALRRCFERAKALLAPDQRGIVRTDKKASYARLVRELLPEQVQHVRIDSRERRGLDNPLFRINRTLALLRDGVSRLVRRTWAASKRRVRLERHLWVWIAFRNYVRRMINRSVGVSAASALRLFRAPLTTIDLLGLKPQFRPDPTGLCTAD